MILEESSLDKTSAKLKINKKTAFHRRHNILPSLITSDDDQEDDFTGITQSDDTFFLRSEKGMKVENRPSRKCGGIFSMQVLVKIK